MATTDDEGEPDNEWRATLYTMRELLNELDQLGEADTGELRNLRPGIEKMEFILSFKKIINRILNRFAKHTRNYELLGDATRNIIPLAERETYAIRMQLEAAAIERLRDLLKLRHILHKLDEEEKETIYRIINYLVRVR